MKSFYQLLVISAFGLLLGSCASTNSNYVYDDLYYSPKNDPINKVKKDPSAELNKTNNIQYQGGYENRYSENGEPVETKGAYQNRYATNEQNQNNAVESSTSIAEDAEYFDEEYSETLQRMSSPVRSLNTYDPYTRDRILYTNDPFFTAPSAFRNGYNYDPFLPSSGLSLGYNSYNGWNVGVNVGYGYNYSCVAPLNPFYNFYDPFAPRYYSYWGYNNFYNPYCGYGYGGGYRNNYANGYNRGFNDGYG